MVHCVVFGCGSRSDRDNGIGFYRKPPVIKNKSVFEEELIRKLELLKISVAKSTGKYDQ